jgi:FG-GAP repeat
MRRRASLAAATLLAALGSQAALFPAGFQPAIPLTPSPPSGAGFHFGSALAVGDGVVAVGAYLAGVGGAESGAVYLFRRDMAGNWPQVQPPLQGGPGDWFGFDVAIDGATLLVGAPMASNGTGARPGAAYRFDLTGFLANGGPVGARTALPIPAGRDRDQIGSAVAASGGAWAVGARGDSDAGSGAGSVYVDRGMGQVEKLFPDSPANGAAFGQSVSLELEESSGSWLLAVGAPLAAVGGQPAGAAYVFESGTSAPAGWLRTRLPAAPRPEDAFGYAVALSGGEAVVGAPLDDSLGTDAGAAYLYRRQAPGTWQLLGAPRLDAGHGAAAGAQFGVAVAFDRAGPPGMNQIVVGARLANGGVGAAYLFSSAGGPALPVSPPPQLQPNGEFGFETAIQGGTLVVGAFLQGGGAGAAYLFAPAVSPPPPVPQVVTVTLVPPNHSFPESAGTVTLPMPVMVRTSDGLPTAVPVTVQLGAVAGIPAAGSDFRLLTDRVSIQIPKGQPQGPVKVPAVFAFVPDPPCSGDETLIVKLLPIQQPGVLPGKPATETVTLQDDLAGLAIVLANPPELRTDDDAIATDHFTVALCSQPAALVVVGFTGAAGRGTLSPPALSFTPADWNQPQVVAIRGVDTPGCVVGPPTHYAIAVTTTSADPRYAALSPPAAPVYSVPVALAHLHRTLIFTNLTANPSCDGAVLYTVALTNLGECPLEEGPTTQLSYTLPWDDLSLVAATADRGTAVGDLIANQVSWSGALAARASGTPGDLPTSAPGTSATIVGLAELQPSAIPGQSIVEEAILTYASHPGGPADTTVVTNPATFVVPAACNNFVP